MRSRRTRAAGVVVGLWLGFAGWAPAQDKEEELRLDVDLGYRWEAMFRGSRELYRSQLDFGEGPKLLHSRLFWAPAAGEDRYLDRLELQLHGWGGEPYNTAQLRMGKAGIYDLDFRYQNAHYFSSIPSFANPHFEAGDPVSQHREDTSLRTATMDLRLWPGRRWSPFVSYQRTTRFGRVDTTMSAPGDEFLLVKDLSYSSDDLRAGLVYQGDRFTATIQQGGRWYRDTSTWEASEFQVGNSTRKILGRSVELDRATLDHEVRSRIIPYSIASLALRPVDRVTLRARVSYWMSDLRTRFYEDMVGSFVSLVEPVGFFETLEQTAWAHTKRPEIDGEFTADVSLLKSLEFVQRVRIRRSHVDSFRVLNRVFGNLTLRPEGSFYDEWRDVLQGSGFVGYNTDWSQSELRFRPHPTVELRGGYRFERRKLELPPLEEGSYESAFQFGGMSHVPELRPFQSDRDILKIGGSWRPSSGSRLSADYEKGWVDQPLYRSETTGFDRLRLSGVTRLFPDLELFGNVRLRDAEEDLVLSEDRGYGAGFHYQVRDGLAVSGEWQRTRWDVTIPYVQPQTLTWDLFNFRELSDYGRLFFDIDLVRGAHLELGYSVWGNVGDFPLNFHQPVATFEVPLGERVTCYARWNYYDYNEKVSFLPQDYRAHLVVFGFRTTFSK